MDQMEPFVLSVCSIHSGSKNNIIPDDAVLEGTIRTLNEKVRSQAKKHFEHVIRSVSRHSTQPVRSNSCKTRTR